MRVLFCFVILVAICQYSVANVTKQIIDNGGLVGNNSGIVNATSSSTSRVSKMFGKLEKWAKDKISGSKDKESSSSDSSHRIPGTKLKTRTYYKISSKKYRSGMVTFTSKKNSDNEYRYIQIDDSRENAKDYRKGGDKYKDIQWEFISVSDDKEYRWYKLRNRGRPEEYLSFSSKEYIDDSKFNYMTLEPNPEKREKDDLLFRPVSDSRDNRSHKEDSVKYYQLKVKGDRDGVVAVSKKEYKSEAFYLQLVTNKDEKHREKFEKGNKYYEDSLLVFEEVKKNDD